MRNRAEEIEQVDECLFISHALCARRRRGFACGDSRARICAGVFAARRIARRRARGRVRCLSFCRRPPLFPSSPRRTTVARRGEAAIFANHFSGGRRHAAISVRRVGACGVLRTRQSPRIPAAATELIHTTAGMIDPRPACPALSFRPSVKHVLRLGCARRRYPLASYGLFLLSLCPVGPVAQLVRAVRS